MLCAICFAQKSDTLTLKDLEIPISPGFILLDQAPTSIESPNTTKAFSLSVLNSFTEANGFPKNYAVELTPFWFFKYKGMNVLKYSGFNNEKPQPFSAIKMATLSMAYINTTDALTDKPINNIAFGVRTNLLKIYPKGYKEKLIKANLIAYQDLKGLAETLKREGATDILKRDSPEVYNAILLRVTTNYSEKDSISPIEKVIQEKALLSLDGAVAYNMFFMNNDFSTNRFGRFGTWLTLNFAKNLNKENTNYFNLYFVGRYLSDGTSQNSSGEYQIQNLLDFGGKVEVEFNKLSLGYEYIYRTKDKNNTYRSTGQLKYRIADNMYLTGAFGKNFGGNNNLVSLLGINWGLSTGNEKAKIE